MKNQYCISSFSPLSWHNDVNFHERGLFYERTTEKDAMLYRSTGPCWWKQTRTTLNDFLPGSKTGVFHTLRKQKFFSRVRNTNICSGFQSAETTAYVGWFLKFGFVAVFRSENEVGIDENISVGYKGWVALHGRYHSEMTWPLNSIWTFFTDNILFSL